MNNEILDNTVAVAVEEDSAKSQARAQYESVSEMVERVEHCRSCDCEYDQYTDDPELCDAGIVFDSEEEFDEYHNEDEARQAIEEDALEVSVRSGWSSSAETMEAEDFLILLCTGGPACRIRGELSNGQPDRAWMEYQDWGTFWTQYFDASQDVLLSYAQAFYFGE